MYCKVHQTFGLTVWKEIRLMPRAGRVLVKKGQSVTAQEVVAETVIGREHVLIDITLKLNLPPEKAQAAIVCKEGQRIQKGDLLAQHKGLIPRSVRAAQDARVLLISEGKIFLETRRSPYNLQAGLPGIISEVHENFGVTIEAKGALIQGLWGNQRLESGQLSVAIQKPHDILSSEDVDVSHRGMVVVGGHCNSAEVLAMARDSAIRGMILSSLDPDLVPLALKMSYPIMTTDGLGRRPMNAAAFKLLASNSMRNVSLLAQKFDYQAGIYPKALITIPNMSSFPEHDALLEPELDQRVIITSTPYAGRSGFIRALPQRKITLPNGIRVYGAHVELDNGEKIAVPLSNLEIIQ